MGVQSFFYELKVKVSPSRLFKASVTDSRDVLPKVTPSVKSVEFVEGHAMAPGCVYQTNFHDDLPIKFAKNRVDVVDVDNYVFKFTTIEGEALGDKFEKIYHELKFEASEDGGSVVKLTSEYHTKGDFELSDEDIQVANQHATGLYKASEEYLIAHPHVCA